MISFILSALGFGYHPNTPSLHHDVLRDVWFDYGEQAGSLCATLYPAPGNIIDWMYGVAGVKYAYALHLGDTGTVSVFSFPSSFLSFP